jgi:hypothetical protein
LAFFLVHPNFNIPSTSHVPSQDLTVLSQSLHDVLRPKLPFELCERIVKLSGVTMSKKECQDYALELMEERKEYKDENVPRLGMISLW